MQVPVFFEENLPDTDRVVLSPESSKHIVRVLRMQPGEELLLTDGRGLLVTAKLTSLEKREVTVLVVNRSLIALAQPRVIVAISLIKSPARFEWFLEKATEIGVAEIIPLIARRTEKQHFRPDRMRNVVISAMLQSQQAWLPRIHEPASLQSVLAASVCQRKYIAHCNSDNKMSLNRAPFSNESQIILIGPEGDFTGEEIAAAMAANYLPVSLGGTRLRTETAGIVAAVLLLQKSIV
jgi:16S rRNA (uracil1498-N3)-methyltransferase